MTTPKKTIQGLTFFPLPIYTDSVVTFGAPERDYFPKRELPEVPKEFEDMAMGFFYSGGTLPRFHKNVDLNLAKRAIRALLGSFNPSHESKMRTVGYALWLWTHETALDGE